MKKTEGKENTRASALHNVESFRDAVEKLWDELNDFASYIGGKAAYSEIQIPVLGTNPVFKEISIAYKGDSFKLIPKIEAQDSEPLGMLLYVKISASKWPTDFSDNKIIFWDTDAHCWNKMLAIVAGPYGPQLTGSLISVDEIKEGLQVCLGIIDGKS